MSVGIKIDPDQTGKPLTHYWRVCVGGGRIAEALRADFQKHLETVQREMPFGYLRMHGLFHEDMMIYREQDGQPILNWQYVDLAYDHWLSIGIRPFVELGFMPYDLASGSQTVFWWQGNVTPPKDWDRWEWLIGQFVRHVIERYGVDEVRRWYFEVWNEPNLTGFWKDADFDAYMELYARTTRAIKQIDAALKVGGPASSGSSAAAGTAPWGEQFLAACRDKNLPVDFFSTHPYPTLHPVDLTGTGYMKWDGPERLLVDLHGYDKTIQASAYPHVEKHYTEWSSSPSPRDPSHDAAFMAPFIVQNNWRARGLTNSLSFWVVSDIFEENRVGDTPFHGGFGLINVQGLKKPSYHGYWFLSRLGQEELASGDSFAVTRHSDGRLSILLWNYCHYSAEGNDSRSLEKARGRQLYDRFEQNPVSQFTLDLSNLGGTVRLQATRFDRDHGSVYDEWLAMGAPAHIRREDLEVLRKKMESDVSIQRITAGSWSCTVEPHGVTLLDISVEP